MLSIKLNLQEIDRNIHLMFFFFSERVTIQLRKNDRPRLLVCLVGSKITVNNYYRKKEKRITKEMKKIVDSLLKKLPQFASIQDKDVFLVGPVVSQDIAFEISHNDISTKSKNQHFFSLRKEKQNISFGDSLTSFYQRLINWEFGIKIIY